MPMTPPVLRDVSLLKSNSPDSCGLELQAMNGKAPFPDKLSREKAYATLYASLRLYIALFTAFVFSRNFGRSFDIFPFDFAPFRS